MRIPAGILVYILPLASAFYLPGAAPTNYRTGERVEVLVNALTPMLTGKDDLKLVSMPVIDFIAVHLLSTIEISHQLYVPLSLWSPTNSVSDDYYNPRFHFCQPQDGPKAQPESLGSILFGDRLFNSPYEVCHEISRCIQSYSFHGRLKC